MSLIKVVKYLISTDEPKLIKKGLQDFCNLMENGYQLSQKDNFDIKRLLSNLLKSNNTLIRRWLYKTIGLIGDRFYVPFLKGQILENEKDIENISWAIAAISKIGGVHATLSILKKRKEKFYGTSFELSSKFFFSNEYRILSNNRIKETLNMNDGLSLKWLSLLFGYNKNINYLDSRTKTELIAELNLHEDPYVVEYSIWAIFKNPFGSSSDLEILPQNYEKLPDNARKWYYRLLTKHADSVLVHFDLIKQAILCEKDPSVREGIALGLSRHYIDNDQSRLMLDWFKNEKNPMVRSYLVQHFLKFSEKRKEYGDLILAVSKKPDDCYTRLLLSDGESIQNESIKHSKIDKAPIEIEESKMKIPLITNEKEVNTSFLAVDTVDFTSEVDKIQLSIFKDLLSDFSSDDSLKGCNSEQIMTLLTGDGLIIGFRQVGDRLLPLHLALSIKELYDKTRGKKLRFGISSGPVNWLLMSDGTTQVIGHAINWTVRVMSLANDSEIFLSDSYYETIVRPSLNSFKGYDFIKKEGLKTKKDEPISAYSVNAKS